MAKSALASFNEIEQQLSVEGNWTLFLDFDGTLTPIVSTPGEARLGDAMRGLLHELSVLPGVRIAVISGRAVNDLAALVDLDLIYAGDHALEIDGPGLRFTQPDAAARQHELRDMVEALRSDLTGIAGVLVESKHLSASVHYRNSLEREVPFIRRLVERRLARHNRDFVLREGKMVFEIRPSVDWNKGLGAAWILEQLGGREALSICIGDDETDEDLFAGLPRSLTVRVGAVPWTSAKYFLAGSSDVFAFLTRIHQTWSRTAAISSGGPDHTPR
jgi:trehalose 6-phosphate phosphatase